MDSKQKAAQLATLLAEGEGRQILSLMSDLKLLDVDTTQAVHTPPGSHPTIGIWEAQQRPDGVHLVRSKKLRHEWSGWADIEEFHPKSGKRRVVVIGESVAHGWFLAPAFTPCKVLAQMLGEDTEVLDLSRINMALPQAMQLNSLALEHLAPDVIVHFSGNNWGPLGLIQNLSREDYAELTLEKLVESRKAELSTLIRTLLESIAATAKAKNVPLLFVIPEFNFGEWKDTWYGPWLGAGKTSQWYEKRTAAEAAFETGDLHRCIGLANDMLALDGGAVGGAAYDLLARCSRAKSNLREARKLFEKSWDAIFLNSSIPLARCLPSNREAIASVAAASGCQCIDLRDVFDQAESQSPLFADYCHLSVEGIRLAMSAVAKTLAKPGRDCTSVSAPPHSVEIANSFGLALQNSALPDEILARHLRVLADDSREWIPLFLELAAASGPLWMNRKLRSLFEQEKAFSYLRNFAYASDWNIALSQNLIGVAKQILGPDNQEATGTFTMLLHRNHEPGDQPLDLLSSRYSFLSLQEREFLWTMPEPVRNLLLPSSNFYRAYKPESPFAFAGSKPLCLSLTYRTPHAAPGDARVEVSINQDRQACLPPSTSWHTCTISIPADVLNVGQNWLRIGWPKLTAEEDTVLKFRADRMQCRLTPELYPVFGEIHSLTVRVSNS
jgi:hypothetical protein